MWKEEDIEIVETSMFSDYKEVLKYRMVEYREAIVPSIWELIQKTSRKLTPKLKLLDGYINMKSKPHVFKDKDGSVADENMPFLMVKEAAICSNKSMITADNLNKSEVTLGNSNKSEVIADNPSTM